MECGAGIRKYAREGCLLALSMTQLQKPLDYKMILFSKREFLRLYLNWFRKVRRHVWHKFSQEPYSIQIETCFMLCVHALITCPDVFYRRPDVFSTRSDVFSTRSDVFSTRSDVFSTCSDVFYRRTHMFSTCPEVFYTRTEVFYTRTDWDDNKRGGDVYRTPRS